MELKNIIEKQKNFDAKHVSSFQWNEMITSENIDILDRIFISMVGEFGELANIIKKIRRGDSTLDESKDIISEELADIFIYLLKLSYQLNIDIEKAFLSKLDKNEKRFSKYRK